MLLNCHPWFSPCASTKRHIRDECEEGNEEGYAVSDSNFLHVFPADHEEYFCGYVDRKSKCMVKWAKKWANFNQWKVIW